MTAAAILDRLLLAQGMRPIAVGWDTPSTPHNRAAAELKSCEITLRLDLAELGRLALKGSPEVAHWNRIVAADEAAVEAARVRLGELEE